MTSRNPGGDPAPKPKRRTFSPEYKLRIVTEYDGAPDAAGRGAILRRERLYHSHIQEWRVARDVGALAKLTDRRTSPRPTEEARGRSREREAPAQGRAPGEGGGQADAALEIPGKGVKLLA